MATLQLRVDDELKKKSDDLFQSLGLDTSTAIRIFLTFSNWFFSKAEKIMRKFGKKCFERISKRLKLLIFNKRRKKI